MPDAQFPLRVRLRQAADYRRVLGKGRRQHDACFTLIILPRKTAPARMGMVVSKKVSRLAVQRNRIKRQIRESFRRHQKALPPMDLVVMAKPEAARRDKRQLAESLSQHWQRLS